jgi:hypothetical protein
MKVAIITCGSDKQYKKCPAKEMYIGSLFVASRKYVESVYGNNYCILSAKYHLLHPDDIIEPYDMFLGKFKKEEKQEWWRITSNMLLEEFSENTEYEFYAGKDYIEGILPVLDKAGRKYNCYLNDLGMGYKIQWFQHHTKKKAKRLF